MVRSKPVVTTQLLASQCTFILYSIPCPCVFLELRYHAPGLPISADAAQRASTHRGQDLGPQLDACVAVARAAVCPLPPGCPWLREQAGSWGLQGPCPRRTSSGHTHLTTGPQCRVSAGRTGWGQQLREQRALVLLPPAWPGLSVKCSGYPDLGPRRAGDAPPGRAGVAERGSSGHVHLSAG